VGLDLASLEVGRAIGKLRDPTFRARILLAYECRCAVCGYEGQVKGFAVGLDAAHARWWASGGPDAVDNGLCLCSLHHKLLDSGVLGLTDDHRLLVSMHFVARTAATRSLVLDYTGRELIAPQAGQPRVASGHIAWHRDQVFKAPARAA
jgi:putative restriction endonuclease